MVNFFDEIARISGQALDAISTGFKVINMGAKSVYIEGFKELINFSLEEISFKAKNGKIIISGSNMEIKTLGKDYALITGKILNINTDGGGESEAKS